MSNSRTQWRTTRAERFRARREKSVGLRRLSARVSKIKRKKITWNDAKDLRLLKTIVSLSSIAPNWKEVSSAMGPKYGPIQCKNHFFRLQLSLRNRVLQSIENVSTQARTDPPQVVIQLEPPNEKLQREGENTETHVIDCSNKVVNEQIPTSRRSVLEKAVCRPRWQLNREAIENSVSRSSSNRTSPHTISIPDLIESNDTTPSSREQPPTPERGTSGTVKSETPEIIFIDSDSDDETRIKLERNRSAAFNPRKKVSRERSHYIKESIGESLAVRKIGKCNCHSLKCPYLVLQK